MEEEGGRDRYIYIYIERESRGERERERETERERERILRERKIGMKRERNLPLLGLRHLSDSVAPDSRGQNIWVLHMQNLI